MHCTHNLRRAGKFAVGKHMPRMCRCTWVALFTVSWLILSLLISLSPPRFILILLIHSAATKSNEINILLDWALCTWSVFPNGIVILWTRLWWQFFQHLLIRQPLLIDASTSFDTIERFCFAKFCCCIFSLSFLFCWRCGYTLRNRHETKVRERKENGFFLHFKIVKIHFT